MSNNDIHGSMSGIGADSAVSQAPAAPEEMRAARFVADSKPDDGNSGLSTTVAGCSFAEK